MDMKRTIEMILMTLLMVLVAAFVGSALIRCSSDDEDSTPIDTSNVKINEVVILSKDNRITDIAQTHDPYHHNPHCYKSFYRDPYHPEDPTKICLLQFSSNISGSTVTDELDVQLHSLSDLNFGSLKIGDSFECTEEEVTHKVGLGAAISVVRNDDLDQMIEATSGRITVVDNRPVDGIPTITLKIDNLTFSTCTLSGTIQFHFLPC